ncbi:hypothetical protein [Lysobacter gummosus]|uniref:hypothetical protein n=1 Tax=Lysobacter gummosus TaxID=262324 RepID=UPI0036404A29
MNTALERQARHIDGVGLKPPQPGSTAPQRGQMREPAGTFDLHCRQTMRSPRPARPVLIDVRCGARRSRPRYGPAAIRSCAGQVSIARSLSISRAGGDQPGCRPVRPSAPAAARRAVPTCPPGRRQDFGSQTAQSPVNSFSPPRSRSSTARMRA